MKLQCIDDLTVLCIHFHAHRAEFKNIIDHIVAWKERYPMSTYCFPCDIGDPRSQVVQV